MRKYLDYFLVLVGIGVGVFFFFQFDLENILWNRREQTIVSARQIEEDRVTDYTGLTAGEGVISLTTAEEWEDVLNEIDYVTVTPTAIYETDVYGLSRWVGYYSKKSNGSTGRRREEAVQSSIDYFTNYSPYYIIELEDGSRLLAQMNRGIAKQIASGESVQLPLGRKLGFYQTAKNLLAPLCSSMNVSTDYVLYTIDDNWESEHSTTILLIKFGISAVIALAAAVILQILAGHIFPGKKGQPVS